MAANILAHFGLTSRFLSRLVLSLAFVGCGGGGKSPAPALSAQIPTYSEMDAMFAARAAIDGGRRASMSPATDAGVVSVASVSGFTAELLRAYGGVGIGFEHDIEGDGVSESLDSLAVDGQGVMVWWRGADCRLAWRQGEVTRLLVAECGAPGALACAYEADVVVCSNCDAERCGECVVAGSQVQCGAVPPEVVEPVPEVTSDTGAGPDSGAPPDAGNDVVEEADDDTATPDVAFDVSVSDTVSPPEGGGSSSEPVCESLCLEEQGGTCCLDCACALRGACQPACRAGYEWDCTLGCCYQYDLFACDCPPLAPWDAALKCCSADGACVD